MSNTVCTETPGKQFLLLKSHTSDLTAIEFNNFNILYILIDNPESLNVHQENTAFMFLDTNEDGYIDFNELTSDLEKVVPEETWTPEALMEEADTNEDGRIDVEGELLEAQILSIVT